MDVFLFLIGLGCLGGALYMAVLYGKARHWPTITAEVLEATIISKKRRDLWGVANYYYPAITYRYQLQGRRFTSSRFTFVPLAYTKDDIQTKWLTPALESGAIPIFYNPQDEAQAVICRTLTQPLKVYIALASLAGLGFWTITFI